MWVVFVKHFINFTSSTLFNSFKIAILLFKSIIRTVWNEEGDTLYGNHRSSWY